MSDRFYLKMREVRSRYYGYPPTYEAQIQRRRFEGAAVWSVVARSGRHATREEAQGYGVRLADRRRLRLENDPRREADPDRLLRQAEFKDRYGDD